MKELKEIVKLFEFSKKSGQWMALATVVKTSGSVYRKPGARMLVTSTGKAVGTLSGGCLENDVCYHVENSMSSGQPLVVSYDTTTDEDLYFGLGLGCNGVIQILIEQFVDEFHSLNFLADCLHRRQMGVLATVFGVEGVSDVGIGNYLILNGTISSNFKNAQLAQAIAMDAQLAFQHQQSAINQYHLPQGTVEVFIEVIKPPPSLTIFGAGLDSVPLARLASELGWEITVVDTRKSEATVERFGMAEQVILTCPEKARECVNLHRDTIAVVMTHNYLHDLELLKWLLPSLGRYLGILGPRHRTERLLKELQVEGITLTEEQRERLYAPIGLDIGAQTPEAIALSIVAEIQAVLTHRSGKFLRERQAPIHQPLNSLVKTLSIKSVNELSS